MNVYFNGLIFHTRMNLILREDSLIFFNKKLRVSCSKLIFTLIGVGKSGSDMEGYLT